MFLNPKILNRLMKESYKTEGLRVCMKTDGWVLFAGLYWRTEIKKEAIPKETLGDLIKLIGEIPEAGQTIKYSKEGGQLELDYDNEVWPSIPKTFGKLKKTSALIIGEQGTLQRVYQDPDTGFVFAVNNVFTEMVSTGVCEVGENRPESALYCKTGEVYWINNACRLKARIRQDFINTKYLEALEGAELLSE